MSVYQVTPEEIERRRKRILTPPDFEEITRVHQARAKWLKLHGHEKPALPLWVRMEIPHTEEPE